MEDLLDWLYDEAHELTPETISVLIDATDLLARLVSGRQDAYDTAADSIRGRFGEIMGQVTAAEAPVVDAEPLIDMDLLLKSVEPVEEAPPEIPSEDIETPRPKTVLPRHTRTLRVDMDRVDELVNLVGEVIIALSGFDQNMDIFIDSVTEIDLSRGRLREAARNLEVGYEVKAIQASGHSVTSTASTMGAPAEVADFDEFDALELDRYSEFNLIIRTLNEAVVDVGAIGTQLANIYSDFDGYLTRLRVLLSELQDKLMSVRMVPMASITNRMHRTVREVASNLGKKARFVVRGEEIELDRVIWEKLTDPLMHLLRNAVDHGLEHEALRQAMDKPPVGTVQVHASREGNQVVLRIRDDGAGLDFEAIRRAITTKGLSDRAAELSEDELLSFIFQPGFSTREDISDVSGRGVGLDVVEKNIQDLKGTIRAASWRDQGTQFTIRIPLTLAAVRALLFNVGDRTLAIPLNEIREIVRVDQDIIRNEPETTVTIGDEVLPLCYTARVLNAGNGEGEAEGSITSEHPLVLLVEAGGRRGALVVDTLVGQREIVIKSLGSHLRYVKGVSGVTIMGDGSVVGILNTEELLGTETAVPGASIPDQGPMLERPLRILVVDDSVSIRQVVSRLMDSQGWKTQTAKDGIEALERVSETIPDLIVLDLEMPRMNGYEFMSALRTQPRYKEIPIVILTSRTAEKHRQKAGALGAKGFIVKPYDDDEFIDLVQNLTGINQP
jgi:chemosensory pili system protein ChpA (sensor histidine kinase/response regulator)